MDGRVKPGNDDGNKSSAFHPGAEWCSTAPPMQPIISVTESLQDLCVRLPGAEERRPGDPRRARSSRCSARTAPARRRSSPSSAAWSTRAPGTHHGRRPRHHPRLPRRPRHDRAGAAGAHHRRVRDGVGERQLQPRAVRQAEEPCACGEAAEGPVAVGQEGFQDRHAVGRHEAAAPHRQGAGARAGDPLPRRADGRRRRGAAGTTCGG